MANICGCIPANIERTLADLPKTLDETYQRTLREIKESNWEFAHRLFQFVAVASRPLRVEELSELLAFDFGTAPIPEFHEDWRLEDPVHAVLSTCSSLLAIADGLYRSGKVIQFSHFSVKEYLTSARLAKASDIISHRYHVSMAPAHTLAAQACLGILLHLDKDVVTRDSLEKWPLAGYAAANWVNHAQFKDVSQNVKNGTKQLFDPNKPHLVVCVWIHDPRPPERPELNGRAGRPVPLPGSSLHYAALWGLDVIVESLVVEFSQNVNSRGFTDHVTPLHLASERGHVTTARMLIERGADLSAKNNVWQTPLHLASQAGQVEVARMLIERGADPSAQNQDGETPLHRSSQVGQVEFARMLIECGADPSAQNKDGDTPLHRALAGSFMLYKAGNVEIVRMLIERGADPSAQNKDGETPLHRASQAGQVEIARTLIERGANPSAQNKDGDTPLHRTSQAGQVEIARTLIERGADPSAQNKDGDTPLHRASAGSFMLYKAGNVEIVRMLIERGADPSAQNKDGDTPLHRVSQAGQVEIARMLIERGADPSAQNKDGDTPLHRALAGSFMSDKAGNLEIACMLIERGADPSAQNKDGETHYIGRHNPDK